MADITISTEEPKKQIAQDNDIKKILYDADEYNKIKAENDKMEAELSRREELKARMERGGNSFAGQIVPEKTEQQKADEEAARLVKQFR